LKGRRFGIEENTIEVRSVTLMTEAGKVHFWAEITFLPGKSRLLGWRPDFFYPEDLSHGYAIWPVEKEENLFGMFVLDQDFFEAIHSKRCVPGCRFELREGNNLVATGVVVANAVTD